MKLSDKTLSYLKNFATINTGIAFKPGNKISTVSPQKNILGEAEIEETIPVEFCIYDLNNFLSAISLVKDNVDLSFDRDSVIINDPSDGSNIYYRFTNSSMVVAAPEKRPTLPSVDVEFTLSEEILTKILRHSSVLGFPHLAIESDGTTVSYRGFDASDDSTHNYVKKIDDIDPAGKTYRIVFNTENLKMIHTSYKVEISSKGIAKFTGVTEPLFYFVTLDTATTY